MNVVKSQLHHHSLYHVHQARDIFAQPGPSQSHPASTGLTIITKPHLASPILTQPLSVSSILTQTLLIYHSLSIFTHPHIISQILPQPLPFPHSHQHSPPASTIIPNTLPLSLPLRFSHSLYHSPPASKVLPQASTILKTI